MVALAGRFEEGKPITGLDFTKCFDYVHLAVALAIMQAAGFPVAIVDMPRHVWQQHCYLEFSGYSLGAAEEVHSSMPQGDGLSPLVLNVILSAACRVAQQAGHGYGASNFLDDRAFVIDAAQIEVILRA